MMNNPLETTGRMNEGELASRCGKCHVAALNSVRGIIDGVLNEIDLMKHTPDEISRNIRPHDRYLMKFERDPLIYEGTLVGTNPSGTRLRVKLSAPGPTNWSYVGTPEYNIDEIEYVRDIRLKRPETASEGEDEWTSIH